MHRLEHRRHSGYGPAPWTRSRRAPAAPQSVYEELLGQLLGPLQRRRREAQRSLGELARRRAVMSRLERTAASQSLRAQAVQIRNELARLSLVESLTRRILQPLVSRDAASPAALDPLAELASQAPWPTGMREEIDARQRGSGRASLAR